jgi:2-polyprenyl-3-methyl-5-hydroxy-6-metoxy-1,4-benzoquinol methylase
VSLAYDPATYWTELHRRQRGRLSAVGWPRLGEGFNRESYRLRLRAAEHALREAGHARPASVLEAAVGVGAYAPLWRRLGVRRWTGVDISPQAVADLRERFPEHRFAVADLAGPSFGEALGDERFALVTAIDVLFHLTDDAAFDRALRHLAERVAPGGALVVSAVFTTDTIQRVAHVRHRPLASFLDVLEPRGFRLDRVEPVFAILAEPFPASRRNVAQLILFGAWAVVWALLMVSPQALRDRLGAFVVRVLGPLDRVLRERGLAHGTNLELAVFTLAARAPAGLR